MILNEALHKDGNSAGIGWNYTHITTAATTVVKATNGVLHTITINTPVASGVINLYDNASTSGTVIGVITLPSTLIEGPITLTYDALFLNGLTIISTGTFDVTVTYI